MVDTWTHKFVSTRIHNGEVVKVTAGIHKLGDNARPYFSVTAEIWDSPGRYNRGWDSDSGGCCHDTILAAFPKLAPVVALHLSSDDGSPMHNVANGMYHLGFGKYGTLDLGAASRHFRITEAEAEELRERVAQDGGISLRAEVERMRERWAREAREAVALLDSLVASIL